MVLALELLIVLSEERLMPSLILLMRTAVSRPVLGQHIEVKSSFRDLFLVQLYPHDFQFEKQGRRRYSTSRGVA